MGSESSIEMGSESSIDLLIFGYIHIMEHILTMHHDVKLLMPRDITKLCKMYYTTIPCELFMLTNVIDPDCKKTKISNGFKCIDFHGRKIIRLSVYDINNKKKLTTTNNIWECAKGGLTIAKNINLPSFIATKYRKILSTSLKNNTFISKKQRKSLKRYSTSRKLLLSNKNQKKSTINVNILFKTGGQFPNYRNEEYTNICLGILFDSSQLDWIRIPTNGFSNIDTLQLQLPCLPFKSTATTIYSHKYNKLICFMDGYGYGANIYQLSFENENIQNMKDWQWNIMTCMKDNYSFNQPSIYFINERELLMCGGIVNNYQLVQLYDMENNKWNRLKDMTYTRCGCGIYYNNKLNENIFIGGGLFSNDNGTKIVEKYDLVKDMWYCLPETYFEHNYYPAIWMDANIGKDILFIAGFKPTDLGIIEWIDLRDCNQQWMMANKYLQHNITNAIPKNAVVERLFAS
eukprot:198181_1